jgi:protein-tyrosine-phosphatase/DNA-binding transcriptional ArsR family regulator
LIPSADRSPDFLKLLAHDVRWRLVSALAESDRRVQELVALLGRPQNLISYHLRQLRGAELVNEHRSSADGRDVYYSLNLEHLRSRYLDSGGLLHPALACAEPTEAGEPQRPVNEEGRETEAKPPFRILCLCTHNSARSQLAEGIMRSSAGDRVEVASAGSEPSRVHPLAIRAATALNVDISEQRSKGMDDFAGRTFDYVITVCDQVREVCPVFPNDPQQIHWGFRDPAAVEGTEEEQFQAFMQTARELTARIGYLRLMLERRQP